jgi:hypothetical protein
MMEHHQQQLKITFEKLISKAASHTSMDKLSKNHTQSSLQLFTFVNSVGLEVLSQNLQVCHPVSANIFTSIYFFTLKTLDEKGNTHGLLVKL